MRIGHRPKAFLEMGQQLLVERAVQAVEPFADEIIVGVRPDDVERTRQILPERVTVVAGGETRQATVATLTGHATGELVLLHEVARPFATMSLFSRVLEAAAVHGAAALFLPVPVRDSLALVENNKLQAPISRDRVVTLQAPHAYRRELLLETHRVAELNGWVEDGTAALVQRAGYDVYLVPGSVDNLKVTYPEDLGSLQQAAGRRAG